MPSWMFRPVVSPSPAALSDTFTGINGTALNAHVPDLSPGGISWTDTTSDGSAPVAGSTEIFNNRARITASTEGAFLDSGLSDFTLDCDILVGTASRFGIILRGSADGSMMTFRVRQPESLIELVSWASGTPTVVGSSVALAHAVSTTYRYRFRAQGAPITVWRDGVQVLSETTATFTVQSKQGVVAYGSSLDERYDNFTVRALGETPNREDAQLRSKIAGAGVASRIRRGTVFADRVR